MNVTDRYYIFPPKPLFVPANSKTFDQLDSDKNWIGEVKKNGWRMMVRVGLDSKIELWTRNKTVELTPLPNLRKAIRDLNLPPDTILDGELMEHRGETKEQLMLWGMFRWNGKWLNTVPYKEIMWRMSFVPNNSVYLTKPSFVFEGKKEFYEDTLRQSKESEGLVLKHLDSPVPFSFTACQNVRCWLKVKPSI